MPARLLARTITKNQNRMKYTYEIQLEASSEAEADKKMQSLITMGKKLKANELAKMADVLKNDPIKTGLAKQFLGL